MNSTWTVVCFEEEGSVEAVPSTWIIGDNSCYFPRATKEKLGALISNCKSPNTEWPTYKIKTFRNGTYDEYMRARTKARIAEETSDLNSDLEAPCQRRKKIRKLWSDSDSEELDDRLDRSTDVKLPSPPKFKNNKELMVKRLTVQENRQKSKDSATAQSCDGVLFGHGFNPADLEEVQNVCQESLNLVDRRSGLFEGSRSIGPEVTPRCNNSCGNCCRPDGTKNNYDKALQTITTQCHIIRSITSEVLQELKNRKLLVHNETVNEPTSFIEKCKTLQFPLQNLDDLSKFDDFLSKSENFELTQKEIARSGGNNSYDFIKRALTPILSNQLAVQFNWYGKKNKRKFSDLKLATILIAADKQANISKTTKVCEKSIASWLKRAKERQETVQRKFSSNSV